MKNLFISLARLSAGTPACHLSANRQSLHSSDLTSHPLRLIALLALMIAGIGNMWGATTVTYTFTSSSWGATSGGSSANWTSTTNGSSFESASPARGVANSSVNGKASSPSSFSGVTSISVVASSNKADGTIKISIGSTAIATKTVANSNNATYTFNSSDYANIASLSGTIEISVTAPSSKTLWVKSVSITYITEKFTVTYNAGSGSCGTTSKKQDNIGEVLTLPIASPNDNCYDEGWRFAGWAKSSCSETTVSPTMYAGSSSYLPMETETLYAVYKKVSDNTITTCDTMMVSSELNSKWIVGGRYQLNQTRADKTSVQLMAANSDYTDGYVETKNLYGDVSAVTLVACGTNANVDTLSYSANGTTWTKWTNYCSVSSSSTQYYTNSFTMTSFPKGDYYLRVTCNTTSHYIFSISITSKEIFFNSNPDCVTDLFVDFMHDNVTISKQGTYSAPAALSDASKGSYCEGEHFHFLGWIEEQYVDDDGTLNDATKLKAPGASITADNKTFYAVWAKEEE